MSDSVNVLPTRHILRPHHVNILKLMMLAFHSYNGSLPPPFLLHLYRILMREVAEVSEPRGYAEIQAEVLKAPMVDSSTAQNFCREYASEAPHFDTEEQLSEFFQGLNILFPDKDEDESGMGFNRRSLFGFFCRRCYVSFRKLSFIGVSSLLRDYKAWVAGSINEYPQGLPGYSLATPDSLTIDYEIYKTHGDKKPSATSDDYAALEKGLAVGDENIATESLRRFFEQHFHEGNDSGLRQHALLSLARKHYLNHEYVACRKYLQEAVGVARTSNDKVTLQHCMSMLHRLAPLERGQKPIINDIQPDLHPLEVLHDVQKLIKVNNQQPLMASFEKIVQAIGLYDHWIDIQHAPFVESEQWGQHAVQSVVWSMHGCPKVAQVEENIVTAFTEAGGDDHNRLVVTLNRAYYRARQGRYREAIATLLEPDVWRGLTLNEYHSWAGEIWHILVLRASRRRQERQFADFLKHRRPHGFYRNREYWFWSTPTLGSIIRDPLYEVMQMREVDQAHAWVEPLLTALWHAEFHGTYGLYRTAIIILADIGLEFGMTKWSRRLIEEIMPQVIEGNELEQRAFACFTLARCIIAAGDSSQDALRECLPYLLTAEKDYTELEIFRSLQDVQYLLAIVYDNLGKTRERDEVSARHMTTDVERQKAAIVVVEDWVADVWDIVTEVGAALAAR
ncbi:uncharacterized protein LAESUDRAFT_755040 [Laetiporus sulphureus 93-53]|uniref:Anaphase-promoting complex subunit 5 n=1 Tax=Laetiporus sulphureus 93-53 TaxID=1314785 RepID=A0A165H8A0_9APHY|nr:uncharacterized protein LAESUDRAFT_755040 [Laetiporus sulphureus 93-53]KZT11383.1 hypothetical protein LAESUDRAFT_755040 [Laetiporus sulphureus 93-53]